MISYEPFKLYPSKNKLKKYDIYVPITGTGKTKRVSFGAKGYKDFIEYYRQDPNLARERRQLYRLRHRRDRIDNPYYSAFWSYWVLWNKPTLGESLEDAIWKARNRI